MNKKIWILWLMLLVPSLANAQTNIKASELNALATPDSADILIIGDTSASESKKITYANFVSGIGGTGLGANLSSSGNGIFSNTGTITLGDDDLSTTGTMSASHFVATSSDPTVLTKLEVTGSMAMPVGQNCPALVNGQTCIDTNIGGFPSTISYVGSEGERFIALPVSVAAVLNATQGQGLTYDAVTDLMVFSTIPAELWLGTAGTLVYPKTPTTTDMIVGNTATSTADHAFYASGAVELNKQKADVALVFSGDNETNLIYMNDDKVGIGTNNPQSILEVTGTLIVSGTGTSFITLNTCASANPCSENSGDVPNKSIFCTTGNLTCFCNASGADIDVADGTSCF